MNNERAKVFKQKGWMQWTLHYGGVAFGFATWQEAMDWAIKLTR